MIALINQKEKNSQQSVLCWFHSLIREASNWEIGAIMSDYNKRACQIIKQIDILTLEIGVTLHSLKFCVESLLTEHRRPLPAATLSEIDCLKMDIGDDMNGLAMLYDSLLRSRA